MIARGFDPSSLASVQQTADEEVAPGSEPLATDVGLINEAAAPEAIGETVELTAVAEPSNPSGDSLLDQAVELYADDESDNAA